MRTTILGALAIVVLAAAAHAEYPTPEQAGFHHCALIYDAPTRGPEQLALYVANDRGWLFDAFLFLHQMAQSGERTMSGQTTKSDWEAQLDRWFAPGRDLQALNEAIEQARRQHGDVAPREVMFSVPYLHPKVTDFGDVDGDGVSEDLSTPEGRARVAAWYMTEAQRRFEAADLPNLRLWGLYWMNEGASDADVAMVRQVADAVHAAGKRMLWIPWFKAPNWDRWREMGIDVAIMQPNYAFLTTHRGGVRRNRLVVNARAAREGGLGVEIELAMAFRMPGAARLFRHYLRDGAADREGYQQAATAYYLGRDAVEQLAASTEPRERSILADLYAYVQGDVVAEPDPTVTWYVDGEPVPLLGDHRQDEAIPLRTAEADVPEGYCDALDVMLHEPDGAWAGLVTVEGRRAVGEPWKPAGWALRDRGVERDGPWQVLTVPLAGSWERLRVRFEGGDDPPQVSELAPQPALFAGADHLAVGAPYTFSHPAEAHYGDSGGELTDGRIPDTGFPSGETVGWNGPPAAITFDLEQPTEITHAEVHVQGGGWAAVYFPDSAFMIVSDDMPVRRTSGRGAMPPHFAWFPAEPIVIDRRRSDRDMDGHLTFRPDEPVTARYVTFVLDSVAHLMVSEVRIFSGGENVAAGREYSLQPPPTPVRESQTYPDDGHKLTDGQITGFAPRAVVGWHDNDEDRSVVVDLQGPCRVDEVAMWTMTGAFAGIVPLPEARVALSEDGEHWTEVGSAQTEDAPDDPSTPCAAVVDCGGRTARYVRVTTRREANWAMLSEIEVRGERLW